MTGPLISVCLISYNQADFIAKTLDSVLMQKVNGTIEIVVADDHSTDGTTEIIYEYSEKFPSRLRILEKTDNLGMHRNWERAICEAKGKYVAILEGDDYWIDFEKLQKQINQLEKKPNISGCFTNACVLKEDGTVSKYPYVDKGFDSPTTSSFFQLNFNPIPTCTLVFRRSLFVEFPAVYFQSPFADWILHSLLIQKGEYIYIDQTTSVYRQHNAGVWSGINEEKQLKNKLSALNIITNLVETQYEPDVQKAIHKQLDALLYFYREHNAYLKFFRTWLQLKFQ